MKQDVLLEPCSYMRCEGVTLGYVIRKSSYQERQELARVFNAVQTHLRRSSLHDYLQLNVSSPRL